MDTLASLSTSENYFNRSLFDAMPPSAIIDDSGQIIDVNRAWIRFGQSNGSDGHSIGLNYLKVCDTATGDCSDEGDVVSQGLRELLAGERAEFNLEYPCHSPDELRWFNLRAARFWEDDNPRVLITHQNITRWKLTEAELLKSEARYRLITENVMDVISRHRADGTFLYVSGSCESILGYQQAELVGQRLDMLFHADDRQALHQNVDNILLAYLDGPRTHRMIRQDGGIVWIETTARPMYDPETGQINEFICVSRDVTERHHAEMAIRNRDEQYTALFNHSLDAILIAEDDGTIVDANPTACQLFGLVREELIGLRHTAFAMQDAHSDMAHSWDTFLEQGEMETEFRLYQKQGEWRDVEVRAKAAVLPGRHLLIFRDITEQKRAEAALITAHNELEMRVNDRTAHLKLANEEVRRFAYIVSHDLRAPLINIQGFVSELRSSLKTVEKLLTDPEVHLSQTATAELKTALYEDIPEAFDFIHSAVGRMDHFINAILKLSRLGRRELHIEEIALEPLIESVLKSLAHQIVERNATILLGDLPTIRADRTAMEQILGNILTNAVIYLSPERPGQIEICIEDTPRETLFKITDNGVGIAKENQHKVFEPFRRAGRNNIPGEGMGLAYVQTLIRRHGGRIWFESTAGEGTTFIFTIKKHLTDGDYDF